ncbi:hypothetical protein Droror1_Dr00010727 [Drosera rotundifolia]
MNNKTLLSDDSPLNKDPKKGFNFQFQFQFQFPLKTLFCSHQARSLGMTTTSTTMGFNAPLSGGGIACIAATIAHLGVVCIWLRCTSPFDSSYKEATTAHLGFSLGFFDFMPIWVN